MLNISYYKRQKGLRVA